MEKTNLFHEKQHNYKICKNKFILKVQYLHKQNFKIM